MPAKPQVLPVATWDWRGAHNRIGLEEMKATFPDIKLLFCGATGSPIVFAKPSAVVDGVQIAGRRPWLCASKQMEFL